MYKQKLLTELHSRGKPLADVGFSLVDGNNMEELIEIINGLGPDIEVRPGRYNVFAADKSQRTIEGDATREALERLFGWRIERAPKPKWNALTGQYDGVWEDSFYWVETQPPQFLPDILKGRIKGMGLSQPGTSDDGNEDLVTYALPQESR